MLKGSERAAHRERLLTGFLCLIPLALLYLTTTADELTWAHSNEDAGDLVTAAYTWGIPHPTGYPWYLLTCKLLMTLLPTGTIAFRAHCYSILMSLAGTLLIGLALRRMLPFLIPDSTIATQRWGQVAAMLLIGTSGLVWSQSIIAEVYAANFAFAGALLYTLSWYLTIAPEDTPERGRAFCWYAGILGLAMTNHLTSAYFGVAGLVVLFWERQPMLPVWKGEEVTWPARAFPPKVWGRVLLTFLAPLSLYFFLMIRSRMNPYLDWTNVETLHNLALHATGRQFRFMLLGQYPVQVVRRFFVDFDYVDEFGIVLALVALVGLGAGLVRAQAPGRTFLIALLTIWAINIWHIANYSVEDFEAFLVPSAAMLGLFIALGLAALLTLLAKWPRLPSDAFAILGSCAVIAGPVWLAQRNYPLMDIPLPTEPAMMVADARANVPDGALVIERYYGRGFAWWYFQTVDPSWRERGIEAIYIEPLQTFWGKAILAREHPTVRYESESTREAEIMYELVAQNIDLRPVYVGFSWLQVENFAPEPQGRLFRMHRVGDRATPSPTTAQTDLLGPPLPPDASTTP